MRIGFVIFFSFSFLLASAQQFGAFPPSVKWKEINTDTARIIFQSPILMDAERIAAIIYRIARENPNPLGTNVRKVNTVLHSNTIQANGFVTLAPFRSEFYLVPHSDIFSMGANPWQDELAVHEYRHVLQNSNFNVGLSKFASRILGEEGQGLLNVMAIPDWFYEGDAVHAESSLTPQGRGRIPNFFNGFHELFSSGRQYSWMKLRNGSLKDYVPNHYELGYLLVNYGYLKYGHDFWGKVTRDAAAYRSLVYPFQSAIKKHTGLSYEKFRNDALDYYNKDKDASPSAQEKETLTNYYYPQFISADSLLYLKSSYKKIPAFYIRDSRGEHRLTQKNIGAERWFSYRNGKILYTSYDVNARWNLIDYNDLVVYDIHSGGEKKLTRNAKYFTPDFSPSASKIIAVFVNDSTASELHLLGSEGNVLRKWPAENQEFFLHPRFVDEEKIVYAARLKNSMMSLLLLNTVSGEKEDLVQATPALLGYPFVQGENIYFVSSLKGSDDLYVLNLADRSIKRIEGAANGRYYPSAFKEKLAWSQFGLNGLQLQTAEISSLPTTAIAPEEWKQRIMPHPVAGDNSSPNVLQTPIQQFPVGEYRQGKHLFNFHSWRPYYEDPEYILSLFSDNVLTNFSNEIFYRYNQNETSHALGFNSSYGGLFPVLTGGVNYTMDRTIRTTRRTLSLNELEARAGFYIPLNYSGGKTYRFLTLGSNFVHNQLQPTGFYKDSFQRQTNNYFHHYINWSQQLPRAVQQIFPKFAYAVSLAHRHLIGDQGNQFLGSARLFLPSFGNHSIVLSASLQETDTANLVFSNRFAGSRGYREFYFSRMWKASANYHMPLVYPDWGFANLIYFLRLRSNVFYDFTRVYSNDKLLSADLRSVGAEIYFDTKVWNALPVSFGFRLSHLLDRDFSGGAAGRNVFEFILPVDLIPR